MKKQRIQFSPGHLWAWNFTFTVTSQAHGKVRAGGFLQGGGGAGSVSGTAPYGHQDDAGRRVNAAGGSSWCT